MNAVLTESDVIAIRGSTESDAVMAKRLGVKRLAILRARTGKTFQNVKAKPLLRNSKNLTK